jgi:hypothetical protein
MALGDFESPLPSSEGNLGLGQGDVEVEADWYGNAGNKKRGF